MGLMDKLKNQLTQTQHVIRVAGEAKPLTLWTEDFEMTPYGVRIVGRDGLNSQSHNRTGLYVGQSRLIPWPQVIDIKTTDPQPER